MTLLCIPDAAEHVGKTRSIIDKAIARGELAATMAPPPAHRKAKSKLVKSVDQAELEAWAWKPAPPPRLGRDGKPMLCLADAATHVGETENAVEHAIRRGQLTYSMIPTTNPRSPAKEVRGVEQTEVEEWSALRLLHRDMLHDYRFFIGVHGMSDEQARDRLTEGYQGVTRQMVHDTISHAAA